MRTAAYKVDVASDRRRRGNVPRHILFFAVRYAGFAGCQTSQLPLPDSAGGFISKKHFNSYIRKFYIP